MREPPSFLSVLLLAIVFGSVSFIWPFGRDQGTFAFLASRCLEGDVLYRDVYCDKPPLATVVHMAALGLFGRSMEAIRFLDAVLVTATALLVARIGAAARGEGGGRFDVLAAAIFLYSYWRLDWWTTAQQDGWLALPSSVAVLLLVRAPMSAARAALAGVALGVAFLFKYTAALFLPAAALLLLGWARRAVALLAMVAGFAAPLAALVLWLAGTGSLGAYLEHVRWLGGYASIRQPLSRFAGELFSGFPVLALLGAFGATWSALRFARPPRGDRRALRAPAVYAVWGLASALAVLVQGKFFRYHFLPMLPPLALLGAWAATDTLGSVAKRLGRASGIVAIGAVAAALLAPPYRTRLADLLDVVRGDLPRERYWSGPEFSMLGFSLRDDLLLARALDRSTQPADRVVIWGFEPLVYFVASRDPVGRFAWAIPLTLEANLPELRAEFLEALRSDPPKLFVIERGDVLPLAFGHWKDSQRTFGEFEELQRFVEARYSFHEAVGRLDDVGRGEEPRFLVLRLRS